MAQIPQARLHRSTYYDGTNGATVVADIPGATIVSGGTGNTTLVIDVNGGQNAVPPGRYVVWTEYPSTPPSILDTNLTDSDLAQIYYELANAASINEQLSDLTTAVAALAGGGALVQSAKGTTDASGEVSFTWDTAFSADPTVVLAIQTTTAEVHSTRLTAVSTTGCDVHVARSPVVSILSINVTAAMVNASGVTVHAIAVGAA